MRVRIKKLLDGPGPSETVVAIKTSANREEQVVVQKSQIEDDKIHVWRVGERPDSVLIELPQESTTGNWRLWVDKREVA
jgi:hypothetical protein